jgi:hypothetical protein
MKKIVVLTSAILLAATVPLIHADDAHHPGKKAEAGSMAGQPGMGKMMGNMPDHMKKMMRQMDEIHKTKDPDKRDKLIEVHMQNMHEHMKMMRGMGGMMMSKQDGKGMVGKGQMDQGTKMDGGMPMRMNMMEQRMDMMQMMMEQMVQSERAVEQTRRNRHDHRKTK